MGIVRNFRIVESLNQKGVYSNGSKCFLQPIKR
jgi:hypothetical protein